MRRKSRITRSVFKTAWCPVCGRTTQRMKTFGGVVSRFNRHADGRPKTRREVLAEIAQEADQWQRDPDLRHEGCR